MPPPDYYAALGVPETATSDQIKKAHRKLAREHHPDRNPGDPKAEERFKEVQQAYDVLGDAQKRKEYDALRRDPFAGRDPFGRPGAGGGRFYRSPDGTYVRVESTGYGPEGGFSFQEEQEGFGDLFERFFGGQARPSSGPAGARGPQPAGADLETRLELSFEDALQGGPREVTLPGGETVRITIPKGVEDGTRVRMRGQGQPGPGGRRGDLYLTFGVRPSTRFRREGRDLVTTETVDVVEAVLGTSRTITTAYGEQIKLRIPAGTQPGERLRLRGQGVRGDGAAGDLYVEVRVTLPAKLSSESEAAFRAWAEAEGLLPSS